MIKIFILIILLGDITGGRYKIGQLVWQLPTTQSSISL